MPELNSTGGFDLGVKDGYAVYIVMASPNYGPGIELTLMVLCLAASRLRLNRKWTLWLLKHCFVLHNPLHWQCEAKFYFSGSKLIGTLTSSSEYIDTSPTYYGPNNLLDGLLNKFGSTKRELYPWFQMELDESALVAMVRIGVCCYLNEFVSIMISVGDNPMEKNVLSSNPNRSGF